MCTSKAQSEEDDDGMHKYWKQRMKESVQWGMVINTTNLLHQIGEIFNPKTEMSFRVNIFYMAMSFLNFVLMKYSYGNPKRRGALILVLCIL